jgi:hypothetical protein
VTLVRVYCGLASADVANPPESTVWLTVAIVDDSGRLLDICEVTDDAGGYAELSALLTQRSGGQFASAVATDNDEHVVTQLLAASGRYLAYTDDDSADDYSERFSDDNSPAEISGKTIQRRAIGLARALQAGVLSAVPQPTPRDMLGVKPVLAAHAAVIAGRQGTAATLREVLRELYPAALRAYPDPAEPIPLAILDALPEPALLGGATTARNRDAQVVAELAAAGMADTATLTEAVTALRVAVAETPRRAGVTRAMTSAVSDTIRHSVAAVRSCDEAANALVGVLADKMFGKGPGASARAVAAPATTTVGAAREGLRPVRTPAQAVPDQPAPAPAAPPRTVSTPAASAQLPIGDPTGPQPIEPARGRRSRPEAVPAVPAAPMPVPTPAAAADRNALNGTSGHPTPQLINGSVPGTGRPMATPAPRTPAPATPPPAIPAPAPHPTRNGYAAMGTDQRSAMPAPEPGRAAGSHAAVPPRSSEPAATATPRLNGQAAAPARTSHRQDDARPASTVYQSGDTGSYPSPYGGFPQSAQSTGGIPLGGHHGTEDSAPRSRRSHAAASSDSPNGMGGLRPEPPRVQDQPRVQGQPRVAEQPRVQDQPRVADESRAAGLPPAPEPRPAELPRQREGRVKPPWQADDLPAEPPSLRLVEPPPPMRQPTLEEPPRYRDQYPDELRFEPPSLRLVDSESRDRNGYGRAAEPTDRGADRMERPSRARSRLSEQPAAPLPEPPPSAEEDGDLLIFAATRSAWFTDHDEPVEETAWPSANDLGWQAAEQAARPTVGAETGSGLPRRVPQENLVPGSPIAAPDRPLRIVRDAAAIAAHTTGYFQGWRRGQEVGGYSVGGRPGRESARGWDFSRDHERDQSDQEYEYRSARR